MQSYRWGLPKTSESFLAPKGLYYNDPPPYFGKWSGICWARSPTRKWLWRLPAQKILFPGELHGILQLSARMFCTETAIYLSICMCVCIGGAANVLVGILKGNQMTFPHAPCVEWVLDYGNHCGHSSGTDASTSFLHALLSI